MYFYSMLKWKKTSYMKKIQEIIIDLQKNAITWKNMILEKFRKKNHQIWSLYEGKIPVTNFNSEFKREISHIVVFFTSPTWHNSKNNFNAQRSHKRLCLTVVVPGLYRRQAAGSIAMEHKLFLFSRKTMTIMY